MIGHNVKVLQLAERLVTNILRYAGWKQDTSRKEDFDIPLVSVSSRLYRSEGGVSHIVASVLFYGEASEEKDSITLVKRDFYGEDVEALKAEAQGWIGEQMHKLACASLYTFAEDNHDIWQAETRMAEMENQHEHL